MNASHRRIAPDAWLSFPNQGQISVGGIFSISRSLRIANDLEQWSRVVVERSVFGHGDILFLETIIEIQRLAL